MTDNPFDDLSVGDDSEDAVEEPEPEPKSEPEPEPVVDEARTHSRAQPRADDADDLSDPAFEYSHVRQRPLYARGDTWDQFEATLRKQIIPELVDADILNEETREIHDAVLRLAVEEPERIAELVIDARRRR